jgi:hypothetical protein
LEVKRNQRQQTNQDQFLWMTQIRALKMKKKMQRNKYNCKSNSLSLHHYFIFIFSCIFYSQSRYSQGADESSLFHEDVDESENESIAQISNDQEETKSLSLDDIENASDEGDSDAYTTEGCKQTLAKVGVSHRLIFNQSTSK